MKRTLFHEQNAVHNDFRPVGAVRLPGAGGRASGVIDDRAQQVGEATIISSEQGYLGFSDLSPERYPFREDFIQKFNAVVRDMGRDGEIKEITTRFLSR